MLQVDGKVFLRHMVGRLVRPLDYRNTITFEVFVQTQLTELTYGVNSIQIDVVQRQSALVLGRQNEGRTARLFVRAQAPEDSLSQRRLTGAELPRQQIDEARCRRLAKGLADGMGFFGAVRVDLQSRHLKSEARTEKSEKKVRKFTGVSVLYGAASKAHKAGDLRALIVGDVHSNIEALEAVIADAEAKGGFDQIWSLGDLVGYGPSPIECIDRIRQYDNRSVAGNHDLASVGKLSLEAFNAYASAANEWTAKQLSGEHSEYLKGLPLKVEVEDFTIVHGSPRDPVWEYVVSPASAAASFLHFDTTWCLVGHSHIPFVCRPEEDTAVFVDFPLDTAYGLDTERLIINPGGVGQPRDGDPRASYAVYDSEEKAVYHHRVEYDVAATQEKMETHGLPRYLIERLPKGR